MGPKEWVIRRNVKEALIH